MKFFIRRLVDIEQDYKDLETQLLQYTNKKGVEELDSPVKEALLFLKNINPTEKKPQKNLNILYGGLLVTQKYIASHSGKIPTLFLTPQVYFLQALTRALNGADPTKDAPALIPPPTNEQFKFCSALNKYLKILFKENNSLLGLKSDGIGSFSNEDLLKIAEIIKVGYKLEQEIMGKLHQDFKNKTPVDNFAPAKITSFSVPLDFSKLKADLDKLRVSEIGKKGKVSTDDLDWKRARQMAIFSATLKVLENPIFAANQTSTTKKEFKQSEFSKVQKEIEKNRHKILAGIMLLIREEVSKEYYRCDKPFMLTPPTSLVSGVPSHVAVELTHALHLAPESKEPSSSSLATVTATTLTQTPSPTYSAVASSIIVKVAEENQHLSSSSVNSISPISTPSHSPSPSPTSSSTISSNPTLPSSTTPQFLEAETKAILHSSFPGTHLECIEDNKSGASLIMNHETALELMNAAYYFLFNQFFAGNQKLQFSSYHIYKGIHGFDAFTLLDFIQELKAHARVSILTRCIENRIALSPEKQQLKQRVPPAPDLPNNAGTLVSMFSSIFEYGKQVLQPSPQTNTNTTTITSPSMGGSNDPG